MNTTVTLSLTDAVLKLRLIQEKKVVNFLREYATRDDENKFFEKWLNFNTYRKVTVK